MQNDNEKRKSEIKYRAAYFSLNIISFVESFPSRKTFWILGDQLLRSATSVGANIVEAQAASSRKDFIRFYDIALKSANETRYWLFLLKESNLLTTNPEFTKIKSLQDEACELGKILGASLLTLKGKR